MTPKEVFKLMAEKGVKFVDLRFTDTRGKEQHVSVPIASFGPEKFESGHYFDGSSIAGWKGIQASDMVLLPDPTSCFIDPFLDTDHSCGILRCHRAFRRKRLRSRPTFHRKTWS